MANRFYALFGEQLKHAPDIAQGLGALSVLGADGEETSLHFADRSWFRGRRELTKVVRAKTCEL